MREIQTYTRYYEQEVRFGQERLPRPQILQYDPNLDTWRYKAVARLKEKGPSLWQQELDAQNALTAFNLQTALGERFSVLSSQRTYNIRDGKLYDPAFQTSLYETFARGKEYRRVNGSTRADQEREQAEVETFGAMQAIMGDPQTEVGTTMLFFSPPGKAGSEYTHNFYDTFTLQQKGDSRYIDYRRYSSALNRIESFAKIQTLDPLYAFHEKKERSFIPDDIYFLKHPVRLEPQRTRFATPDVIHEYLHKNHIYMRPAEFNYIMQVCKGYIDAYISIVSKDPDNIRMRNFAYNAILNKADQVASELQENRSGRKRSFAHDVFTAPSSAELIRLGSMPVREVVTGCGSSKGMSIDEVLNTFNVQNIMQSPYSVMDYGKLLGVFEDETYGFEQEGSCVNCGKQGARLGPCGICEPCDKYLRSKQQLLSPVTVV